MAERYERNTTSIEQILTAEDDLDLMQILAHGGQPKDIPQPSIDRAVILRAASRIQQSVDQLTAVISKASASSDSLGNRVWWLNVILTIATAVIAGVAVIQLFVPAPT